MNDILNELFTRFVGVSLLVVELPEGEKRMLTLLIKNGYLKFDSAGYIVRNYNTSSDLTAEEIYAGQTKGKLEAVKMHRERTAISLMHSKNTVEKEFERLGYIFKR